MDGDFKTFEIHGNGSVQVEKGRQLLMRLRPSLREELADCPGLSDKMALQSKARSKGKRPAQTLVSPAKPSKILRLSPASSTSSNLEPAGRTNLSLSSYQDPPATSPSPSPFPDLDALITQSGLSLSESAPGQSKKLSDTSLASPARKCWPNDFFVCEVADGLQKLKEMKDVKPKSNLTSNFRSVFGLEYHKTTYSKYKAVLDHDNDTVQNVIKDYISKGKTGSALWPMFWKEVKDNLIGAGKKKSSKQQRQHDSSSDSDDFVVTDHNSVVESGVEDSDTEFDDERLSSKAGTNNILAVKQEVEVDIDLTLPDDMDGNGTQEFKEEIEDGVDLLGMNSGASSSGDASETLDLDGFRVTRNGDQVIYELLD